MENNNEKHIKSAIAAASESIKTGGGPFGAVVVKDGKIVGRGVNSVTVNNDPTAHAELNAIRDACANLNTFSLKGCTLYTSCEPCPMCLSAIYWSRIDNYYYATTANDASAAGFDDSFIKAEIVKPIEERTIKATQIKRDTALDVFREWSEKTDKTVY
jgi:guanine deaminase